MVTLHDPMGRRPWHIGRFVPARIRTIDQAFRAVKRAPDGGAAARIEGRWIRAFESSL